MNDRGFGVVLREGARRGGLGRLAAVGVVGLIGLGLAGGLCACSSDSSSKPAASSTPLTPTVTVTSTRTAPATTVATPTSTTATSQPATTAVATRAPSAPAATSSRRATTPARPSLAPALVGKWIIHDSVLTIAADGTGTMLSHGCFTGPGGQTACDLLSDLRVTPMGSGARLTVTHTRAYLTTGRLVAVPSWVHPYDAYAAVGDYSVLEPFTAATWPYETPITTADQRAVYSWRLAHPGGSLGNPKDDLARQCHVGLPVSAALRYYCG